MRGFQESKRPEGLIVHPLPEDFRLMRKALIPMLASLALCGAATTALVISTARAQPNTTGHKPMMVAAASNIELAANDAPSDAPPLPPRSLRQRDPAEMAARMKQMCQDGYAREAGELTYVETRLALTAAEQPLFERWKEAKLGIARRHADQCAQRPVRQRQAGAQGAPSQPGAGRPGPDEMMAREEDRLKERLADIEAERPALGALYNALSPEQKREIIHAGMRGGEPGGMMHRPMFADAMGPHGPMGGPPGMGPRGMEGPPGAPPPPPGQ
jgi:hypothetical protein